MNEEEKMKQGQWYDANDEELCRQRMHAKDLCFLLNQCLPSDLEKRNALMKELLPHAQERVEILSPFYTDYGHLCRIGRDTFINHNAYFMDGGTITIGAKSVVTKSLPPYVLAYGNPCRIISAIEKEEDDKAKQITPF